jgi:hypothetical protein
LPVRHNQARVAIPDGIDPGQIIFATHGRFMGGSLELRVKRIIHVVPEQYAALELSDKYKIARLIGQMNRSIVSRDETPTILLGPGRWGTSTPSLGIPVSFAEINKFAALGEIAFLSGGFIPELSYGTHFFQDLVETGIFYLTLAEDETRTVYNRDLLASCAGKEAGLFPGAEAWRHVVQVIDASVLGGEIWLHADLTKQRVLCWRR